MSVASESLPHLIWPDPPTETFLVEPRRGNDLIAYWEWLLYKSYLETYQCRPIWSQRIKTFAKRFSTCATLKQVSQHLKADEERSRKLDKQITAYEERFRKLHQLLTLLFLFYDMVEQQTMQGVFGIQSPPPWSDAYEQRTHRRNQRKLREARRLVREALAEHSSLLPLRQFNELFTQVVDSPSTSGPSAIIFESEDHDGEVAELLMIAPDEDAIRAPIAPLASKKNGQGGDLTTLLTLVVDLSREIMGGRSHVNVAFDLLHHFTALERSHISFSPESLRTSVGRWKRNKTVTVQLGGLRSWLSGGSISSPLHQLCPYPTFLIPARS